MARRSRSRLAVVALAALAMPPRAARAAEERSVACAESRECAARLGYGNVCEDGRCKEYVDPTDLLGIFHLVAKEEPKPVPLKLYPSIIPAIGYNPALGFLIGVVSKAGMLLGDRSRHDHVERLAARPADDEQAARAAARDHHPHRAQRLGAHRGLAVPALQPGHLRARPPGRLSPPPRSRSPDGGAPRPSTAASPCSSTSCASTRWRSGGSGANLYLGAGIRHRPVLRHRGRVARPGGAVAGHHEPLRLQHYYGFNPSEYTLSGRHAERRLRQPGLDHQRVPGDLHPARPRRLPHLAGEQPGKHDGRRSTSARTWGSRTPCPGTCSPSGCLRAASRAASSPT